MDQRTLIAFEHELNNMAAARADGLRSYSTDWLWEVMVALAHDRPPAVDVPEFFPRIVKSLAVPTIAAELRRRLEVAELEGDV